MKLGIIDICIIALYLIATVVIGLVMKKRAQKSKGEYLLGGNKLPWYLLGLSNASGMFDISGTMWLVAIGFVYGLKSIWIPWLWPVFNQIFLMVFLSAWLRRSNVTTGAEWIKTRFGNSREARLSHMVVVIFALIGCIGMLAYGFIGVGKFIEIFIPWEYVSQYIPFEVSSQYVPHFYGICLTLFAMFYAILGGMVSIVWTDIVQYIIMTVSSIIVAAIAMSTLGEQTLVVPEGWMSPLFGWELEMDWHGIVQEANDKIATDGFSLFTVFFSLTLFKGILSSAAGPAPTYDMQKILASKNAKEASLMSGSVSLILIPARYMMITGFVVLGLLYFDQLNLYVGGRLDFEQLLPAAMEQFIPVGLTGMLLAGLLAAFNSTFAGTLNAGQAYIINDLYLKYINPQATQKKVTLISYAIGIILVVVSTIFGFFAKDVNAVLQWVVSALYGGYIASNVLKWYWWRFNGGGYFWGMASGTLAALVFPLVFQQTLELYYFPLLLLISFVGCIVGTYTSPPTDMETLKRFYFNVRPWGFWQPIHQELEASYPNLKANTHFKRDMFNVGVGILWQTVLVATPIFMVLMEWRNFFLSLVLTCLTSFILKKTWWEPFKAREEELALELSEQPVEAESVLTN
ncbi:sodium:solute symporter family protein [Limibacter armeniacum]|uniref:sodium:solute symporter family protein n=1 Tax=Limibacter armeniacum TaxID=466084 RepID=UPI002FE65EA4